LAVLALLFNKRLFKNVVAQFIGREEPDKSGNYENLEAKGFKNAKVNGKMNLNSL
jgi:hypothetical protein